MLRDNVVVSEKFPCRLCGKVTTTATPIIPFHPTCYDCLDRHLHIVELEHLTTVDLLMTLEVHLDEKKD